MYPYKVGILTFHNVRNYGASLQAYALQRKMQDAFSHVEIIQYQNEKIQNELKLWAPEGASLSSYLKAALGAVFRFQKKRAFDAFNRTMLTLSAEVQKEQLPEFAKKYDILITGSDQVWCTSLTDYDTSYFLDFAGKDQVKIAYAPSFGDDPIPDISLVSYLNQMDLLTTREEIVSQEFRAQLTQECTVVCDPTLLLDVAAWESIAAKRHCKKPYAFLFMIRPSKALIAKAETFCEEKGLQLISNKSFAFFQHPSPVDFLSWVKNAAYVFTDSFHGTVFSLIFHRQFACYCYAGDTEKKKGRLLKLLELVHLSHRALDHPDFQVEAPISWTETQATLNAYANRSWRLVMEWFEKHNKEWNWRG